MEAVSRQLEVGAVGSAVEHARRARGAAAVTEIEREIPTVVRADVELALGRDDRRFAPH